MSHVKMNWPLVAIGMVVMAVPFSIALIQDMGREAKPASSWEFEEPYLDYDQDQLRALEAQVERQREELRRAEEAAAVAEQRAWQQTAMSEEFFDWLLGWGTDMTGSIIKAEYFGLDRSELHSQAPELGDWLVGLDSRFAGAAPVLLPPQGPIAILQVTFRDDGSAERILIDRWGIGETAQDGAVRWIHQDAGLIVRLAPPGEYSEEARLTIEPIAPGHRDR